MNSDLFPGQCKLFFSIFLLIFLPISSSFANRHIIEYLYIDANTGQSSGGHTAVKFQDTVFHFQFFPDKIFHIVRETWKSFRYTYTVVENRNIVIYAIAVKKRDYEKVLQRFQHLYLAREKQIRQLQLFQTDLDILLALSHPKKQYFSLQAAGYVEPKVGSETLPGMKPNVCRYKLVELRNQLTNFSFPQLRIHNLSFAKDSYTSAFAKYSFSKKYLSLVYAYQFCSLFCRRELRSGRTEE